MAENIRIRNLFENLYDGNPWIEVTLTKTLENISAERAARKSHKTRNSIWEITNHLISWRETLLGRMCGENIATPDNNYIAPIEDQSEHAWKQTLQRLAQSQQKWVEYLAELSDETLAASFPQNGLTLYEHVHGIIQHDCYHLGQIVLLAKHPD